jgi:predicted metal-dependent hydrolase
MNNVIKICYGQSSFTARIKYSKRKTLGISVLPDCNVVASAPEGTPKKTIAEKLKKRARWIKKQINYFDQFQPRTPTRQYVGGETHLYLGRQYRLRFVEDEKKSIKLKGRYFLAAGPNMSSETAKKLMEKWYSTKAEIVFERRLKECLKKFPQAQKPTLIIKTLKKRWGGMTDGTKLTINKDLVRAPVECIDYVLVHELCHIEYPHHGSEFWALLGRKLPSWKQSKYRLEMALS